MTINPLRNRHTWRQLVTISLAMSLSACSQLPQLQQLTGLSQAPSASTPPHTEAIAQLTHWDVEGKLAVYTANKNNSGNLSWQQRQEEYELLITGPLGQGRLHIKGSPELVTATSATEQSQAKTIDALFAHRFEWPLPINEMRYWVRGIASPATPAQLTYNNRGEVSVIEQADWQVNIDRYTAVNDLPLPSKIVITKETIRLKLILKNWSNLQPFPDLNDHQ